MEHKDLVRDEFTRQANDYAASPQIKDRDRISKLLAQVAPAPDARVLDVASGPGHVSLAFAAVCREVVGVDLTEAPLKIAEQARQDRGIANARFQLGDVDHIPFDDGEFDVVVCRFAVHHFDKPRKVIAEMARTCRIGGTVAIQDLISSENPDRAEYYNRFEKLRDTSHTRALPLSELVRVMGSVGLEMMRFSSDQFDNPVERWLKTSQTPPDRAAQARAMIERDLIEDLSGVTPKRVDGELYFTFRIATVVARKLGSQPGV
ncbi:MAG TPA: methyltransferase domain-containing protein [Candidatus Binataceae bacterium]|nr:methyltransferase domain-containing protein [Candidatus Binataceae bacterium]